MAVMRLIFVLLAAVVMLASALQLTPGSPCESFCVDSSAASTQTTNDEITCSDHDFSSKAEGQKFQRCLSCLQDSTFSQGDENDQQWFLYNVRYAFDFCIYDYPNATGIGSNPCTTSFACGPLKDDLIEGIPNSSDGGQYDYCGTDKKALDGDTQDNCLQCVRSTQDYAYLANFLVALEAGCEQQPASGVLIGLNDTVFSKTNVEIQDPDSQVTTNANQGLSTTAIAGIAVGGFVLLLLAAGCIFMQCRKRKNRAARAARVRSSLSFRCMTHLTPRTPEFRPDDGVPPGEKTYIDPSAALSSNPVSADGAWDQQYTTGGSRTGSAKLSSITTTVPTPAPVHASPQRMSPDDFATPTSTTSVRSNAPLLHQQYPSQQHARQYTPIGFATSSPQNSDAVFGTGLAISTPNPQHSSPFMNQQGFHNAQRNAEPTWGAAPGRDLVGSKGFGAGRPVEMGNIQTKFPPPPKR